MSTHRWTHGKALVRHDADERIEQGETFAPSESELRAFGDRIEKVESPDDAESDDADPDEDTDAESLTDLEGVGEATAEKLRDAGFGSVADVRAADTDELTDVDGISESLATELADG
jgi:large subunit ribosomal protein L32e